MPRRKIRERNRDVRVYLCRLDNWDSLERIDSLSKLFLLSYWQRKGSMTGDKLSEKNIFLAHCTKFVEECGLYENRCKSFPLFKHVKNLEK